MGNKCISKLTDNGIVHTITRSFGFLRLHKRPHKENEAIQNGEEKESDPSEKEPEIVQQPVTVKPPEPMKIARHGSRLLNPQISMIKIHPSESKHPVQPIPQQKQQEQKEQEQEQQKQENPRTYERRVSSHLVQVESVLKRKTDSVKDHYTIGRKLGHGQFATAFLCIEKATGIKFACKSIAKRMLVEKEDVEDARREIEIMHHLRGDPNVIAIKDAFEDTMAVYVVMEVCRGGDLFDRIVKRGHYNEKKAAELARIIISVVQTCHSLGVMHRDLKPENFLFVNEDEDSPLKAIDFGLSVYCMPGEVFTDVVGSPYYVPPEVLRKCYGQEADVWSAGVIFYILLSGVPPFWGETEDEIFDEVLQGELDFTADPWPSVSEDAKDLIRKMLVRDPTKRLTVHEVLCHPWIIGDGLAPDKPLDPVILSRLKQFSSMSKLKKMALKVIAEKHSEEEIAGVKKMFKMMDTDNSGHITNAKLKEGLEKFGASLEEPEIQDLIQAADVNNSGTIEYGEFLAAMLHSNKPHKEDHLLAAFSFFDKGGSGCITRDGLKQACGQLGIDETHLEDIIKEVDQNNDGRIGYNEFVGMMQDGRIGSSSHV